MHEFAIGEELVKATLAELENLKPPPAKLCAIRVIIGEMRQIIPEHLTFAYEVLTKDTPAAGSVLHIITAPVMARCRNCAWEGRIDEIIFLCRECGTADIEVSGGMELYLDQLEVEYEEPEGN